MGHITAQPLMFWEDSLPGKDRLVGVRKFLGSLSALWWLVLVHCGKGWLDKSMAFLRDLCLWFESPVPLFEI